MEAKIIKEKVGKKVLIILRNNFQYTCVIPEFEGETFSIVDKFGEGADISCEYIVYIKELER